MRNTTARLFLTMVALLLAASALRAENVDLSTVPARRSVQLTIYNSEDLTLVRETRQVSFKKGVNPLQFSWANTLIDPTSVELKFLKHADKLEVLDTTFPHAKPQMLYWNVQSELDGEATVEITYFTSGIRWSADYILIANPAETALGFEGFVRVTNGSGEEYNDAQVRLIVGRINLVQRIAELAHMTEQQVAQMDAEKRDEMRGRVLREALDAPAGMAMPATAPAKPAEPKAVAKESLSEYFIYTIEGTETIPNGWSKRMRSLEARDVPLRIQYRYREPEYGPQLVRMYLLRNDKDSKLGQSPLPDGVVRLFRQNGHDGLSFLVAQPIKYIPIGDKIELNLGVDPNVIFELVKLRTWRDDFWLHLDGTDVFRRVGEPGLAIDVRSSVAGWKDETLYAQRVRNYSAKPIDLEVRRAFGGHIVFRSELAAKNHDYQTVEYTAEVPAGKKVDLLYQITQFQGWLAKQNNVTIEKANVQP